MDRAQKQTRTIDASFSCRDAEGLKRIDGYFSVFNSDYQLFPGATESVDPHAFDNALGADIRCLIDHETRLVLGRTAANTLQLRVDDHGLWGSVLINEKDGDAMNLYARVERGDVSQCSFGFDILDEEEEVRSDGSVHWTIKAVKLYEVSCVTFPAYTDTEISARRAEYDAIKRRQLDAEKAKLRERMKQAWH